MADDAARIREDLEALARVAHRYAGTEGEREMLHLVRGRLPEGAKSRIEGFVAWTSPGLVIGAHALLLLLGGLAGLAWPLAAMLVCAITATSLFFEGTGRYSLVRRVLPKSASYNLVWRTEVARPLGTVILSAPLDTPRWRPERPRWPRRPLQWVLGAAWMVTLLLVMRTFAEPWGRPTTGMYVASLLVLAITVAVASVAHRRAAGLHEDASGPAALLELVRRIEAEPIPQVDVWAVFTGCGHAYQNGMHAFLAMRKGRLKEPVLVLALDDPGKGPLEAVVSEGPLFAQSHRPTGPALVERLRWAGLPLKGVDTATITDARAALLWGYRSLALHGSGPRSDADTTLQAVEVAEAITRLYAEDVRRVPDIHPRLRHLLPGLEPPADEPERVVS